MQVLQKMPATEDVTSVMVLKTQKVLGGCDIKKNRQTHSAQSYQHSGVPALQSAGENIQHVIALQSGGQVMVTEKLSKNVPQSKAQAPRKHDRPEHKLT